MSARRRSPTRAGARVLLASRRLALAAVLSSALLPFLLSVTPAVSLSMVSAVRAAEPTAERMSDGDAIAREYASGPVSVTLHIAPAEPRIGDVVELTLEARAEAGVELLMPEFGEALGRFEIVDFAPSEKQTADGGVEARQRYRLQPKRSGKTSIPALRIEFVDRRPGQKPAPEGEDAYEILTERIALDVATILAADAPLELRPPHPDLGRRDFGGWPLWTGLGAGLLLLTLAAPALLRALAAHRSRRRSRSAYEIARSELDLLLARGTPGPETLDAFYVELSLVVRRYLENRFALRSPELTTEEFLNEMGRSPDLARSHQRLLRDFLVQADLVKFAGYRPEAEVVRESIAAAERFLEDTRDLARAPDPGAMSHASANPMSGKGDAEGRDA